MKKIHRATAILAAAALLMGTGCSAGKNGKLPETVIPEFTIPENILGEPSDLVPELNMDKFSVPENEGMAFVRNLKLGWNLGNTFDASDCGLSEERELDYEKAWCGKITTIENIAAIKGAGFQTIRIPVSWHNHVDAEHKISEKWLTRVKEVVDWARACDLYVIVNVHHDNDIAKEGDNYFYPDSAHMDVSKTYLTSIWSQLADVFKDYDEHLILESLNEPRLVGTNYEWWLDKNNPECQDAVQCINTLNQLFVDTVRNSGGNNATRWLMCPGYAASADGALNDGFTVPNDSAARTIVSVHAYTPYNFALNKTGTKEWSLENPSDTGEITNFMDNLYAKFILNGTPVLIGEFGAMNKDNLEDRVQFSAYYTAAARVRGMSCCWWDNNAFTGSGENFGLLTRGDSFFMYPEIVQALMKGSEYGS